jgi:valyl-tRNA synthetase
MVLMSAFEQYLRLFHPFIPFVTEQIWQELGHSSLLITERWPVPSKQSWPDDVLGVDAIIRLITEIRRIRSERGIDPGAKVSVTVHPLLYLETFQASQDIIGRLGRTLDLVIDSSPVSPAMLSRHASVAVDATFTASVTLGADDSLAEKTRLSKQLAKEEARLLALGQRLDDSGFVSRAPEQLVQATRQEAENAKSTIASLRQRLESLNGN